MNELFEGQEAGPVIAPRHVRVFGIAIDYLAYFLLLALFYGGWFGSSDRGIGFGFEVINPNWFACFLFWLLLIVGPEAWLGQTLGKKLMRVQVLSADHRKATFLQCLIRHAFDLIDWLPAFGVVGVIVSSYHRDRKRVGDIVAGTIVVNK